MGFELVRGLEFELDFVWDVELGSELAPALEFEWGT